jgi:hypothetical protein
MSISQIWGTNKLNILHLKHQNDLTQSGLLIEVKRSQDLNLLHRLYSSSMSQHIYCVTAPGRANN